MKLRKCFKFTGKEHYFQGHFPEAPILPGVMQLEFAHFLAREMLGSEGELSAVKKMKFVKVIEPTDTVELEVSADEAKPNEVTYVFYKGEAVCSSGVLVY